MALISEGGNSNGQGFYSSYSVSTQIQPTTAAKPAPSSNVPSIVIKQPFKPTTTELVIVGGLAAFTVIYFATHNRGK